MILRNLLLALSRSAWLQRFVTGNSLARRVSRRFVAGETLEEGLEVCRGLLSRGLAVSLDHLGENTDSPEGASRAAEEYCQVIRAMREGGVEGNVSLKLTQLGLDLGEAVAFPHLLRILEEGQAAGVFVRVDMEGSAYTESTLRILERARERFSNLGAVIQSYLYRSERDVEWLNRLQIPVRLCKGAYAEPPDLAYPRRREVDASFIRLMKKLLTEGTCPAIATHDEAMIRATLAFAAERGIPAGAYEFQMLYGIRRERQEALRSQGYRVRIYVPFGNQWYPYFMRRLAERPANLLFFVTALLRG